MSHPQQTFDKERISMNVVRLKKGGENFEVVLSDPDRALELKQGKNIPVAEVINGNMIFKDAKKGEAAPTESMQKWLGTTDPLLGAEIIIKKGEFHLTAEQRKKIADAKRRQIINHIHENAIDPRTKSPHPVQRIELAMEQAKVQIDPTDKTEWLIEKVAKQLQSVIPLSFERARMRIKIPAKYAGSAYSAAKGRYKMQNESWLNDGSVQFELDIIAGAKDKTVSFINQLTNGEAVIEDLE